MDPWPIRDTFRLLRKQPCRNNAAHVNENKAAGNIAANHRLDVTGYFLDSASLFPASIDKIPNMCIL